MNIYFDTIKSITISAICVWIISGVFNGMLIFMTYPLTMLGINPLTIWYISFFLSISCITIIYYKAKSLIKDVPINKQKNIDKNI